MADDERAERIGKQVHLSVGARDVLTTIKDRFGVTQQIAVERGLEFLLALPAPVLQEVFRRDGDPISTLVRMKLAEQAGAGPDATSIEEAEAIIRTQTERLARLARSYRRELDDQHAGDKSKKQQQGKSK